MPSPRPPSPLEWLEQAVLADLLRQGGGAGVWWHSVPNERIVSDKRSEAMLRRLKRMGLRPGAPDMLTGWASPAGGVALVYIEMKRRGEPVREKQETAHEMIRAIGGRVVVHTDGVEAYRNLEQLGAPFARVWRDGRLVLRGGGG